MTLPDERYRALKWAERFLVSISTSRSGLSDDIKDEARSILRHYPSEYDLDRLATASPEILQKQMEPVYRLMKVYEENKKNGTQL